MHDSSSHDDQWGTPADPSLPPPWQKAFDPGQRRHFYYRIDYPETSTWEKPPEVPTGWQCMFDSDQNAFYFYRVDSPENTTWELPKIQPPLGPPPVDEPPLWPPPGMDEIDEQLPVAVTAQLVPGLPSPMRKLVSDPLPAMDPTPTPSPRSAPALLNAAPDRDVQPAATAKAGYPTGKAKASQPPLTSIQTWVRIRPIGTMGHTDGKAVQKELGDFDEKEIKIISHDQGHKVARYNYMSQVFPVDCVQEDVANKILPDLLNDFWSDRNAMIFAYGQTGTGKTHTMFGVADSLTETSENPGWGLLPRAVHATLRHIEERAAHGMQCILLLSAVEFYCGQAYDLASKAGKQICTMKGHQVIGNSYQHCNSLAILAEFIERVYGNRCVVHTAMNDGSSRSHCAISLTLMTLDQNTDTFTQTMFSIVDLAGAERPTKASHTGTRMTKDAAVMELAMHFKKGGQGTLSLELQGYLINFELTGILTQVVGATDAAKQGRTFGGSSRTYGGSATQFLEGALAGEARLSVLICLSQSPQNGWETWFSIAQYGARLSELRTRIKEVPRMSIAKAMEEAQHAADEAAEAFRRPSADKYVAFRYGMKVYTEQRLHYMQLLAMQAKSGATGNSTVAAA